MASASSEVLLWGLSAEAWTAFSTAWLASATSVLAVATIFLVVIARNQIIAVRNEAKQERTLAYCDRYDNDPVLDRCLRRLGSARESGRLVKSASTKADVTTVLNYLDGLAVGISQGLYINELARDHMESILKAHVSQYLGEKSPDLGVSKDDFRMLLALAEQWRKASEPTPQTLYRDGRK
jgi:hypothetical protein